MDLDYWLFKNKITKTDFAKTLGISRGHLQGVISGKLSPSVKLAKKIEEATEGKVSKEKLLFPEEHESDDQN